MIRTPNLLIWNQTRYRCAMPSTAFVFESTFIKTQHSFIRINIFTMLGLTYSVALIQVNCEDAANRVWVQVRAFPFAKDVERIQYFVVDNLVMRVHKFDLSFIIIHGRDEVIKKNQQSILILNDQYSELVRRCCFYIDIIPSVAKNSIANGVLAIFWSLCF